MKPLYFLLSWILITSFSSPSFANGEDAIQDSSFFFSSHLPPDQINLSVQASKFSINKDRRFNFGFTADSYCYILIKVQSRTPVSYSLSINNTSIDTVHIYSLLSNGTKRLLYEGGNLIKYDTKRNYVWHTVPLIVGQQPAYFLIAVKAVSQNVNVAYQIVKPDDLQRLYRSLDRLVYFYSGIVLLISLISIIGSFVFKRRALLIYTCYVLAVSAWILAHYGYLFPLLFPSFPFLNEIIKQVSSLVAMFCLLHLITSSFRAELNKAWINKTFFFLKLITALLIAVFLTRLIGNFIFHNLTVINILWHLSILFSIGFIIAVLVSLFKTNKTARIFSIAISLVSLMTILQMFSNLGWMYNYFLNEHGILVASLLEMLVLTFGIFYNLWEEKTYKEEELKIAEGERSKTLQMLITVQDEERKRIASDLHDSIGPMLAAIKINFLRMAKAKVETIVSEALVIKTEAIIDDSLAEIRNISHRLMPKGLSSKGLITLLSDYFANLETVHSIRINFTHEINIALEKEIQLNLYRMISELSLNAAKHSEAKTLAVSIKTLPEETLIMMKDDGKGFTNEAQNSSSLGIKNVKSRVEYLKGKLQFQSLPGKGTSIEITIPHKQDL